MPAASTRAPGNPRPGSCQTCLGGRRGGLPGSHLASIPILLMLWTGAVAGGPSDPASWRTRAGPEGGSVTALAVHRAAFLAAGDSVLYRLPGISLTDSGGWAAVSAAPRLPLHALHADSALILAGTEEGVLRSDDGGATWSLVRIGDWPYVFALARQGRRLFAGSENGGGIFRSEDEGLSWAPTASGLPLQAGVAVYALLAQGGRVYAGTTGGLYVSEDSGSSWSGVTGGFPDGVQIRSLAGDEGAVYAGSHRHGVFRVRPGEAAEALGELSGAGAAQALAAEGGRLWAGTDAGGAWLRDPAGDGGWAEANRGLQGVAARSLACSGNLRAAAWKNKVFLSRDQGASWTTFHTWDSEPELSAVGLLEGRLYHGSETGLRRSNQGATAPGLQVVDPDPVRAITPFSGSLIVGGTESLQRMLPGASSPTAFPTPDSPPEVLDAPPQGSPLAGLAGGSPGAAVPDVGLLPGRQPDFRGHRRPRHRGIPRRRARPRFPRPAPRAAGGRAAIPSPALAALSCRGREPGSGL